MAWLCLYNDDFRDSQMVIVTGPNQDLAIKLIRRMKGLFADKLGVTFDTKETVIELNGCSIEAYPSYTEYKGINRQAANFIFIDLDRSSFKTDRAHISALTTTLENIKQKLNGNSSPTVLWSGNGYHIYQPVNTPVLEEFDIFTKFKSPSRRLMQYAESFLSNNKADHAHNVTVSFKNCMLRVPGSINSKNGQTVKLLQIWDGRFPKINPLLADFYIYLCGQRIKELTNQSKSKFNSKFGVGSRAYLQNNEDGHGSYYQCISIYLRFRKTYFMSSSPS